MAQDKASSTMICKMQLVIVIGGGVQEAYMHAAAYLYILDLGFFLMLLLKVLVYRGQLLYILQKQQ